MTYPPPPGAGPPQHCPDDNVLAEYVQGALPPERAHVIAAHLERCHRCASALHLLAHLATEMDATPGQVSVPEPAPDSTAGPRHIGRYELVRELGTGGMGVVYLARDPRLGREVALKVIRPDLFLASGGDELRRRFDREARVLARLSHPNVVAVHDAGEAPEGVYIAMEYVDGAPLSRWLAETRPARWEIVEIFLQAGQGLAAAHGLGLVHRDVKPDNILVGRDGRARISDFGLAVPLAPEGGGSLSTDPMSRITQAGQLLGTPAYMSPEQLAGAAVDARSDQFSFAATLFEALIGRQVTDREAWVDAHLQGRASQRGAAARLPLAVRRVLTRGLRSDPRERYADLNALLADLAPAAEADRWIYRRSRRFAVVAVAVLLAVAAGVGLWASGHLASDSGSSGAGAQKPARTAPRTTASRTGSPAARGAPPTAPRAAHARPRVAPARRSALPALTVFKSPAGRFRMWLPGTPTRRDFKTPTPAGSLDFHTWTASHVGDGCDAPLGCNFVVGWSDFPKAYLQRTWPGQILDRAQANVARLARGKLADARIFTLDGYPARLLTLHRPATAREPALWMKVILLFVEHRLYQIQAITAPGKLDAAVVGEVLSSFKLWTPPPPARPSPRP